MVDAVGKLYIMDSTRHSKTVPIITEYCASTPHRTTPHHTTPHRTARHGTTRHDATFIVIIFVIDKNCANAPSLALTTAR